jgi:hypothetical protein
MAETDREQDARQAANDEGADPANAPSSTGPNLPRQVERNLEGADTGPARNDGDKAASAARVRGTRARAAGGPG